MANGVARMVRARVVGVKMEVKAKKDGAKTIMTTGAKKKSTRTRPGCSTTMTTNR